MTDAWPELATPGWLDTATTVHMWTQIIGKIRMAHAPVLNHWWHVTLYVSPRGLTTGLIPYRTGAFDIEFDFVDHQLHIRTSDGRRRQVALEPKPVAQFYAETMAALGTLDIGTRIHAAPNEVEPAIPFAEDHVHAFYDPPAVELFWGQLLQANRVVSAFRSGFVGKASPVHFFWGGMDLAYTRFSGRTAPPHPGGAPNCPPSVMREGYSHELASCGFWPGGGAVPMPVYYAYAYPEPPDFAAARVEPTGAFYSSAVREFILPYDVVRTAPSPDDALLRFFQTTYDGAADLARWDRAALERTEPLPRR